MRDILFRGKRVDGQGWVQGLLTQYQGKLHINKEIIENPTLSEPCGSWSYIDHIIIPETVGQYTGLKDKNGKMIFEGDIVKLDDNTDLDYSVGVASSDNISHHEIYWDNERAMFWDKRIEDGDSLAGYCDSDITFVVEGKVIGNIHDDNTRPYNDPT